MEKLCQYCFKPFDNGEHRKTAEHIFPAGIIALFPEQQISFPGNRAAFVDNRGMTISDVCKRCNNFELSRLDSYGKSVIEEQFLEEIPASQYDKFFTKRLDYMLLTRWILKIIYNSERALHNDVTWFLSAIGFILHGLLVENFCFSMFAGIHINTSPLPENAYLYLPMQINKDPRLFRNSLGIVSWGIDPCINTIKIAGAQNTFCVRLGTAVFYCILWKKETEVEIKRRYDAMLQEEFDFVKLTSNINEYQLKCISSHSNTTAGYGHLITKEGIRQDRQIIQSFTGGREPQEVQDYFKALRSPEDMKKGQVLVETLMFPENKAIKRKYDKLMKE